MKVIKIKLDGIKDILVILIERGKTRKIILYQNYIALDTQRKKNNRKL